MKCYKITEKTGNVVGAKAVGPDDEIMIINTDGIVIRMECAGVPYSEESHPVLN